MTSGPFEPLLWRTVGDGFEFTDLTYHRHRVDGQDNRQSGSPSTGRRSWRVPPAYRR